MSKTISTCGSEDYHAHRSTLETCPECGQHQSIKTWLETGHTLCLNPRYPKLDHVSVTTECPKCFTDSWVHVSFTAFPYAFQWDKEWCEAIEKRTNELKLDALRSWAFSCCGRCANLITGQIHHDAQKVCTIGNGEAKRECPNFKSIEKLT